VSNDLQRRRARARERERKRERENEGAREGERERERARGGGRKSVVTDVDVCDGMLYICDSKFMYVTGRYMYVTGCYIHPCQSCYKDPELLRRVHIVTRLIQKCAMTQIQLPPSCCVRGCV